MLIPLALHVECVAPGSWLLVVLLQRQDTPRLFISDGLSSALSTITSRCGVPSSGASLDIHVKIYSDSHQVHNEPPPVTIKRIISNIRLVFVWTIDLIVGEHDLDTGEFVEKKL